MALVKRNAAILVKDADAFTQLIPAAFDLIKNSRQRAILEKNCRSMALQNAAASIVDELYSIMPER
jgi:UDP-N-acetylglucosamine--N-acetylmuramyl-(pentapeptide) pyrophosphoryl-undecaprenol N-acetylglucosamine transferase